MLAKNSMEADTDRACLLEFDRASGMAAVTAFCQMMKAGDHVVASRVNATDVRTALGTVAQWSRAVFKPFG